MHSKPIGSASGEIFSYNTFFADFAPLGNRINIDRIYQRPPWYCYKKLPISVLLSQSSFSLSGFPPIKIYALSVAFIPPIQPQKQHK